MKGVLRFISLIMLVVGVGMTGYGKERTVVRIGAYGFAPYYDLDRSVSHLVEVVNILNKSQNDYQFEITEVPAKRRYQLFQERRYDMVFFEDPKWGWEDLPHYAIPLELNDGEVYVALRKKAHSQSYFSTLKGKRIAGILGYHYGFANYETDENLLRSKFDIYLVNHNLASVRLMLSERVDVAVVPKSYIIQYLRENPADRERIMISEKYDQNYDLKILVSPRAPVARPALEAMIRKLRADARFKNLIASDSN